jgi:hypothetical protein
MCSICSDSVIDYGILFHFMPPFRAGKTIDENAVVIFSVDHKTGRELRQYLSSIADKCERQQLTELPYVIILDGLHHVTSPLGDTFNGFLNVDNQAR